MESSDASKLSSLCTVVLIFLVQESYLTFITLVVFHCNRWSSWFQGKNLNLLLEGKAGIQLGAYFLPLSLASALLCALVSFFNLASPNLVENLATGSSQASFDSDCMALSTAHSQERSLIGPAWVSCSLLNQSTVARELAAVTGGPSDNASEAFIQSGRKSINPKTRCKTEGLWPDQLIDSTNSSDQRGLICFTSVYCYCVNLFLLCEMFIYLTICHQDIFFPYKFMSFP